jgi:iron complex outermembrane recepter protein
LRSRFHTVLSFFVVALFACANVPADIPQELHEFDVSAADAVVAIQQFAAQASVQILADGDKLKGRRLNAVTGKYSLEEGLRRMLAGTGLTYRYVGQRAIALVSETEKAVGSRR